MILRITKDWIQIEITDDNPKEAIKQAAIWTQLPDRCPVCEAELALDHRKVKGDNNYYEVICRGTVSHRTQLGQYKEGNGGGLYYKGGWEVRPLGANNDIHTSDAPDPTPERQYSAAGAPASAPHPQGVDGRILELVDICRRAEIIVPARGPAENANNYLARLERLVSRMSGGR